MDTLVDRTNDLSEASNAFRQETRQLSRQMWFKKMKTSISIAIAGVVTLYLLVGFGCGFPIFNSCL